MADAILSKVCLLCGVEHAAEMFAILKSGRLHSWCKSCNAAYKKDWAERNRSRLTEERALYYQQNKDRLGAANNAWRIANPEKSAKYSAKWQTKNEERVKRNTAAYRVANLERYRIYKQNRDHKMKGQLSPGLFERLYTLQKGKCPCCGFPLGEDAHMDHKMPIARGGSNTDDNMQLLRATCNLQKNAKHPVDFMQSRGFLL